MLNKLDFDPRKLEVVVAPISLHISSVGRILKGSTQIGCQNISPYDDGAFTGEISADQLSNLGVDWVIVGHSERRTLYGETNETVAKKVAKAHAKGLKTIICIGESLDERFAGRTNDVLRVQL